MPSKPQSAHQASASKISTDKISVSAISVSAISASKTFSDHEISVNKISPRKLFLGKIFAGSLPVAFLLALPGMAQAFSFGSTYVFGDSLSDTGNLYSLREVCSPLAHPMPSGYLMGLFGWNTWLLN
jgi:hypothetical protein